MIELRTDWYSRSADGHLDHTAPGIYEWRIEGIGVYIGKAAVLRNRISAYPRNVRALLNGKPWHGNTAKAYRPIHKALHKAHDQKTPVVVAILENCALQDRLDRERWWIAKRREEEAAGGPKVLNA